MGRLIINGLGMGLGLMVMGIAILMQGLTPQLPQDGMLWMWNLACTAAMLAGVLTIFGCALSIIRKG